MTSEVSGWGDARIERALVELQGTIRARWPQATFQVAPGEDDAGMINLWATVDVEDTDEVTDLVIERVVELQVDERVPISVIAVRPVDRVLAEQRALQQRIGGPAATMLASR